MNEHLSLVTTCTFKSKEYLVKMNVTNGNSLELGVTDKHTAEEWHCSYDMNYIENLTLKTGNFKQFDVFNTMLKSGLLKTSDCVTLDLLTFDDLELLRSKRTIIRNSSCSIQANHIAPNSNRRYLILTYTVEFDRIHYPLPMEYCGPPDPQILQATIRRLESEMGRMQEQLERASGQSRTCLAEKTSHLEKRIQDLTDENKSLMEEVRYLTKCLSKRPPPHKQVEIMHGAIKSLENHVMQERTSFKIVRKRLEEEKIQLKNQLAELQGKEKNLRAELRKYIQACRGPSGRQPRLPHAGDGVPAVTCRYPGDGVGSPTLRRELKQSQPSNWNATIQAHDKLTQIQTVLSRPHIPLAPKKSVKCFLPAGTGRSHHVIRQRSSSESSAGSRRSHSATNKNLNTAKSTTKGIYQPARQSDQGKQRKLSAERTKHNRNNSRRRSSASSASSSPRLAQNAVHHARSHSGHNSAFSSGSSVNQSPRSVRQNMRCEQRRRRQSHRRPFKDAFGMSDLEVRIRALQKVLKENLSVQ